MMNHKKRTPAHWQNFILDTDKTNYWTSVSFVTIWHVRLLLYKVQFLIHRLSLINLLYRSWCHGFVSWGRWVFSSILIIQIYIIMRPTNMIHNLSSLASNAGDQSSNHLSTDPREMRWWHSPMQPSWSTLPNDQETFQVASSIWL